MAFIKYITDIEFDFGAVATLPASCAAHGISKPLVVTDAGIKAAGLLDKVLAHLGT
ncbi:MAG: 4-hydroxybutyrate dehydrogenase, partial [Burkholderiaceae bacterium]